MSEHFINPYVFWLIVLFSLIGAYFIYRLLCLLALIEEYFDDQ